MKGMSTLCVSIVSFFFFSILKMSVSPCCSVGNLSLRLLNLASSILCICFNLLPDSASASFINYLARTIYMSKKNNIKQFIALDLYKDKLAPRPNRTWSTTSPSCLCGGSKNIMKHNKNTLKRSSLLTTLHLYLFYRSLFFIPLLYPFACPEDIYEYFCQ